LAEANPSTPISSAQHPHVAVMGVEQSGLLQTCVKDYRLIEDCLQENNYHYEDYYGSKKDPSQNVPKEWFVRYNKYTGITLRKALEFNDRGFVRCFLTSLKEITANNREFFYLQWGVIRKNLDEDGVEWKFVVKNEGYGYTHWRDAGVHFAGKLYDDDKPQAFTDDKIMNFISVATGTRGARTVEEMKSDKHSNYRNIQSFSWKTDLGEQFKLWHLVGNMTLAWLAGKFDDIRREYPDVSQEMLSNVQHLEISTHGIGIPWFHVRIEEIPVYNVAQKGEQEKNPNVRFAPEKPPPTTNRGLLQGVFY